MTPSATCACSTNGDKRLERCRMHTSARLSASDFTFWRQTANGDQQIDFATFSPDYHPQDRIGVISLTLEDGVLHTSYALLAFTTAFYDCLRARHRICPSPARLRLPNQPPLLASFAQNRRGRNPTPRPPLENAQHQPQSRLPLRRR